MRSLSPVRDSAGLDIVQSRWCSGLARCGRFPAECVFQRRSQRDHVFGANDTAERLIESRVSERKVARRSRGWLHAAQRCMEGNVAAIPLQSAGQAHRRAT